MAAPLCGRCYSMTGSLKGLEALVSAKGYEHYSKNDLEASAQRGCPCCALIWTKVCTSNKKWRRPETWESSVVAAPSLGELSYLLFRRDVGSNDREYFRIFVSADHQDPASSLVVNRTTNPGSTIVTEKVSELLSTCLSGSNGHVKCAKSTHPPLLPRRVISVGNEKQDYVELYESKPGEYGEYVTLSYVWGMKIQPITTTGATREKHINGLAVSTLPRTIHDAILTVRRLRFRYLWVDVLCIIQDNVQDKEQELKKMGQYYRDSTLTIAAATASNVQDGFLSPRPPPQTCELPLYLPDRPDGSQGKISIIPQVCDEKAEEPLYTRAWALEEFILPPRLLTFGTRDAIWQCQSADPSPVIPSYVSYDPKWPCTRLRSKEKHRDVWGRIVKNYTSRDMTYLSDRLLAIGGLAHVLESKDNWNDIYLYGMWRKRLLLELMWGKVCKTCHGPDNLQGNVCKTCRGPDNPEENLGVPSWSWAAVSGPVKIHRVVSVKLSAKVLWVDGIDGAVEKYSQKEGGDPSIMKGVKGQLCLSAVVRPLSALKGVIKEGKERGGVVDWMGLHDDWDKVVNKWGTLVNDGTLKFVLLGFTVMGAFGLIIKPDGKSEELYIRVGTVTRFLPSDAQNVSGTNPDGVPRKAYWGNERKVVTIK